MAAIHQATRRSWSVESLADIAQTSRSMFSERFTSVVGVTPARHLTRQRMHLAGVSALGSRIGCDPNVGYGPGIVTTALATPTVI